MIFGKHINHYYIKYAFRLLLGLITLGLVDYLNLLVPNLYQLVINGMNMGYITEHGQKVLFDMDFLLSRVCLPLVGIIFGLLIGRIIWRLFIFTAAINVETDLRDRMFNHARELSQEYYQKNKVGNLMSLFTNDLDTVQECFGWGFMQFFDALFLGVMAVYKMSVMDPLLTVLSLIPMALLMASATIVSRYMTKKWELRQAAFSHLSDFSQESFSGIAVIKAFVKEGKELLAFKDLNLKNEDANVIYTRWSVLLRVLVSMFVESVICVILGYGGYLVHRDVFNAGQLIEFIGYFTSIVWPVMAVADLIDMTSRGKASLNRVSEFMDAEVSVKDRPDLAPMEQIQGSIEFRNLSFSYPQEELNSLKNISFRIQAGEHVGVVGKTGSGKTTLVDLILRTYNVPDGTLFIDGRDINEIPIKDLRNGCAYVPQDNFLFSDTISNNISFGTPETETWTVEYAARLADIDSNIQEFTNGYKTVLGERGVTVSGGQKQRISIARALLKQAPILILDDSVSAVDTKTEKTILDNLHVTRADKTTILIAHRISTIEKMDKIIFIADGALAAMGTHQELYDTCPSYRKMVDLQRLEEEGGNYSNA